MNRNHISLFLLLILVNLIVISCTPPISQNATPTTTYLTPVPLYLKPLTAVWRIVDNGLILRQGTSLSIQAIYLTGKETILLFTMSGVDLEELTTKVPIQITDDIGYSSKLLKIIPLGMVDKLVFGILQFEPRRVGAQQLFLQWSTDRSENLIAQFSGTASEDKADRIYYDSHIDPVEQAGYRISFQWSFSPSEPKNGELPDNSTLATPIAGDHPTPTPAALKPLAELPSGVSILQECSLIFKDVEKDQTQIFNVQLLSNASAIVESNGVVSMPAPIIVNEASPTPGPPPYP